MTERTDTLHEDVCTFTVKSHPFLKMRNILDKVLYKIKTHILCPVTFFPPQKSRRLWANVEKYNRTREIEERNITAGMCFLCWINKATDTHQEYVYFLSYVYLLYLMCICCIICCTLCVFVVPYVYFFILYVFVVSYVYLLCLVCICCTLCVFVVPYVYLLYLMCICCILCVFVVPYVYLLYLMCICCILCVFVYLMSICCTLCVFVVLCVYCCSYFRCRTAG